MDLVAELLLGCRPEFSNVEASSSRPSEKTDSDQFQKLNNDCITKPPTKLEVKNLTLDHLLTAKVYFLVEIRTRLVKKVTLEVIIPVWCTLNQIVLKVITP